MYRYMHYTLNNDAKQPTGQFYLTYDDEELTEALQQKVSVLPVRTNDEGKSPVFFHRLAPVFTIEGDEILETYPYQEKHNLLQIKIDFLADVRWQHESGGCEWNGWRLLTDDRSQSKYQAELSAVNEGVRTDGDLWKFPHGHEQLTNEQVRDMAIVARQHVLSCFMAEGIVASQIDAFPADELALHEAFRFALDAVKAAQTISGNTEEEVAP